MQVWIDQDCYTGHGHCVDHRPHLFVVLEAASAASTMACLVRQNAGFERELDELSLIAPPTRHARGTSTATRARHSTAFSPISTGRHFRHRAPAIYPSATASPTP